MFSRSSGQLQLMPAEGGGRVLRLEPRVHGLSYEARDTTTAIEPGKLKAANMRLVEEFGSQVGAPGAGLDSRCMGGRARRGAHRSACRMATLEGRRGGGTRAGPEVVVAALLPLGQGAGGGGYEVQAASGSALSTLSSFHLGHAARQLAAAPPSPPHCTPP